MDITRNNVEYVYLSHKARIELAKATNNVCGKMGFLQILVSNGKRHYQLNREAWISLRVEILVSGADTFSLTDHPKKIQK